MIFCVVASGGLFFPLISLYGFHIWLAWKGASQDVGVLYFEEFTGRDDFQPSRGRWDSTAIDMSPSEPWPLAWPQNDGGAFDGARYCCFLTLEKVRK